ncbi:MAG TPA: LPS export ABC transporter periplasmic protein LptC [Vicingaceae bacterium]|nr:LPS export ABC transporter periplasmic protein LptC [Vicingaceae bacterium]
MKFQFHHIYVIPLLFSFGIICFGCENDIKEVEQLTKVENVPLKKGKNVELIYSEDAAVKIKVSAPKMEEYANEEPYLEMSEGIKVVFYDSLKQVNTTLTANYAIHRIAKNIMEAKNDVVVVNEKGEQLNTEHLVWSQDSAKIYSDEFVKITTTDEILMGEGFEANEDFTKWKIHKIKGTINLKEQEDSTTVNP